MPWFSRVFTAVLLQLFGLSCVIQFRWIITYEIYAAAHGSIAMQSKNLQLQSNSELVAETCSMPKLHFHSASWRPHSSDKIQPWELAPWCVRLRPQSHAQSCQYCWMSIAGRINDVLGSLIDFIQWIFSFKIPSASAFSQRWALHPLVAFYGVEKSIARDMLDPLKPNWNLLILFGFWIARTLHLNSITISKRDKGQGASHNPARFTFTPASGNICTRLDFFPWTWTSRKWRITRSLHKLLKLSRTKMRDTKSPSCWILGRRVNVTLKSQISLIKWKLAMGTLSRRQSQRIPKCMATSDLPLRWCRDVADVEPHQNGFEGTIHDFWAKTEKTIRNDLRLHQPQLVKSGKPMGLLKRR